MLGRLPRGPTDRRLQVLQVDFFLAEEEHAARTRASAPRGAAVHCMEGGSGRARGRRACYSAACSRFFSLRAVRLFVAQWCRRETTPALCHA